MIHRFGTFVQKPEDKKGMVIIANFTTEGPRRRAGEGQKRALAFYPYGE